MDAPEPPFQFIYNYVDKDDFIKYLRLTVFVCLYVFARGYYANWSKAKQIKRQIDIDNKEKAEEKAMKEKASNEKLEKLDEEAETFGWGKATRRRVKRQEQELEAKIQEVRDYNQSAYDAAEDHDIEDLLQD